jgi:3-hydroxyisobutyrate dehydrogenase
MMSPGGTAAVGFVGLGSMGSRIAGKLLDAGFELAVHDARPEAIEFLASRGAIGCGSAAAVAERCETVLVSLPTPDVVRAVVCDAEGLLEGGAMKTFVDLSTTGREISLEIGEVLSRRGVAYLDAPVSGGVAGAERGDLGVFAAADPDVFERSKPMLEAFGGSIILVGVEPGQGQVAKALNNLLSASAMAITAEALAVGVRDGLEPGVLLEAFNAGSGRNTATSSKFPDHVLNRRFETGFRLDLMLKDLRLALAEGRAQDLPMAIGTTVEELWSLAAAEAREGADHTEVVRFFENQAGITIEDRAEPAHGDA